MFLDTNVLICAFAARGLCADLMRLLLAEHEVLTGEVNLVELRRVLIKRFKATPTQVDPIEQLLRDQTVIPKPAALLSLKVRNADDAWVLASTVAGEADLLVSGDQDLLVLAARAPLPILSPRDAWSRLRSEGAY
ncbi:MAG TPA: putative toxin-antitoxin system toxin component, PIN family [Gemmatimonadaceae bacterium]|nr:putative toxin-antitoxin system toxin component, PIN family [Gemmatimonadaceae bacterium]HRQ79372.1 putative toxin-antitoxin system toxin component, PIN family [Gemmatimonadaceae bacterium]